MIQISQVYKSYGDLPVLNGVDMHIAEGEVVAIVGASGAGKSTLLHILGTLDKPDSGQVIMDGQSVFNLSSKALHAFRNQRLGFVFQFHNLLPEFTALENVCMPALIQGKTKKQAELDAMTWLDRLGLADRVKHRPHEMSGGEQQRVAVARALVNRPAVVLADEPSGNLDSHHALKLHELFFELRKDFNQTFVIVTHNNDLAAMADRAVRMFDGKIV